MTLQYQEPQLRLVSGFLQELGYELNNRFSMGLKSTHFNLSISNGPFLAIHSPGYMNAGWIVLRGNHLVIKLGYREQEFCIGSPDFSVDQISNWINQTMRASYELCE